MDKQVELLEKEDPRFYAIDKSPSGSGTASIATTEKVNKEILNFGLPSSPGLFLNQALNFKNQLMKINIEDCFVNHPHPQGTYPEDHHKLFNFFELMCGHIVFSFLAIETFANISIPKEYKFMASRVKKGNTEEWDKEQIERNVILDDKLKIILPEVLSVSNPSGTVLWNNFINHKRFRNRLVHLKSVDMKSSGPEEETVWGDLLRNHSVDFVGNAHKLIGHYYSKTHTPRWHKKFPY